MKKDDYIKSGWWCFGAASISWLSVVGALSVKFRAVSELEGIISARRIENLLRENTAFENYDYISPNIEIDLKNYIHNVNVFGVCATITAVSLSLSAMALLVFVPLSYEDKDQPINNNSYPPTTTVTTFVNESANGVYLLGKSTNESDNITGEV